MSVLGSNGIALIALWFFIQALVVVREALNDVRVKTGHRFALEERAKKICLVKRHATLRKYLTEIKFTELRKPNIVSKY